MTIFIMFRLSITSILQDLVEDKTWDPNYAYPTRMWADGFSKLVSWTNTCMMPKDWVGIFDEPAQKRSQIQFSSYYLLLNFILKSKSILSNQVFVAGALCFLTSILKSKAFSHQATKISFLHIWASTCNY